MRARHLVSFAALLAAVPIPAQAAWTVVSRGAIPLDTGQVTGIAGLSGVTYVGVMDGQDRFAAVQDTGNQLVTIAASFNGDGSLASAGAVNSLAIAPGFDFEGASYSGTARNSVFLSEEVTPAIREFSLASGAALQTVLPPSVFDNIRPNRGFESLTRSVGGTSMWTANEEALTIDGPVATENIGTTIRLLHFAVHGDTLFPGAQFAYVVDWVHGANPDRSGLVDLVSLPDGTLLALERSAAAALPALQNRIYQIDFAGATDIRSPEFEAGLVGQTFTGVSKTLLWSGSVGGFLGENLEGLALGPRLPDGSWVLLGVVDDGDALSGNTVVSFQAVPPSCDLAGDYNCSGVVDALDYASWRDTFGSTEFLFADGNSNGKVNAADYSVWRDGLRPSMVSIVATTQRTALSRAIVPEPCAAALFLPGLAGLCWRGRRSSKLDLPQNSPHRFSD